MTKLSTEYKGADIQQDLLDLGGELSIPGHTLLAPQRVAALDALLQALNANRPRLQEFVRPGGSVRAAKAHICRTICRRAERSIIALAEVQAVSYTASQSLNRLSRPDVRRRPCAEPAQRRQGTYVGSATFDLRASPETNFLLSLTFPS